MKFLALYFISISVFSHVAFYIEAHTEHPLLLLISFDGFRWDYLHKLKCLGRKTPNFDKLIANGVFVNEGVKNAYITKTFPNHYSIVTGLYEESHGVVANSMFDPKNNRTFTIANPTDVRDPFWFDNGADQYDGFPEPIWLTNRKGKGRRSGVMFWPGSEASGMTPDIFEHYNASIPNITRIDNVIKWFTDEIQPINLGLLYFSEPDHTGHSVGPDSEAMDDLIVALDGLVGYLIQRLTETNLMSRMNIILTSDHGMAEITNTIEIGSVIDSSWYTHINSGPVWNILPVPGKEKILYKKLKSVKHLKVYKKDDIPLHYHYSKNRRIMPLLIEAAEGYNLCVNISVGCTGKGTHGYDNDLSSMHPIFIAHGPAFKKNYTSSQFNNVDIYGLMCHILHVSPAPNNGSFDNIKQILYVEEGLTLTSITMIGTIVFCALIAGVYCVGTSRLYIKKRGLRTRAIPLPVMTSGKTDQKLPLLTSSEEDDFA